MSFLGNILGVKIEKVQDTLNGLIVQFDPATATEAQIRTIADKVSDLNGRLAEVQINIESEKKKIAADEAAVHQHIDAATALSAAGKDDKATLLLNEVENDLNPVLENDKKTLADDTSLMADLEARRNELQVKLSTARARTEAAARDMEHANLDLARAKDKETQAKRDAGLMHSVDQLDVASDAMTKQAQTARVNAQKATLNAQSFGGMASPAKSQDVDIQAALAAAAGNGPKPNLSVADRLAALKAKAAA